MGEYVTETWLITYGDLSKLPAMLEQIRKSPVKNKVVVWDNTNTREARDELTRLLTPDDILVLSTENLMCFGASQKMLERRFTDAPYIVYLCSTHAEINDPAWVQDAVDFFEKEPRLGLVGHLVPMCGIFYFQSFWTHAPNRNPEHAAIKFPDYLPKLQDNFTMAQIYDRADLQIHVQGGVWVARRKAIEDAGGFETALPHHFGDVEISTRLQCYNYMLGGLSTIFSAHRCDQVVEHPEKFKLCHRYDQPPPEEATPCASS